MSNLCGDLIDRFGYNVFKARSVTLAIFNIQRKCLSIFGQLIDIKSYIYKLYIAARQSICVTAHAQLHSYGALSWF